MFKRRRLVVLITVACLILASMPLMNVSALSNGKKGLLHNRQFRLF